MLDNAILACKPQVWNLIPYPRPHTPIQVHTFLCCILSIILFSQVLHRVTCSICYLPFNDREALTPRLLQCGHTFCQSCLGKLLKGSKIECPLDRDPTSIQNGDVSGLKKNYALIESYSFDKVKYNSNFISSCADPEGVTGGPYPPPPPTLENHKAIGFHSNTGPDRLENHKATKPAFNVELHLLCMRPEVFMIP